MAVLQDSTFVLDPIVFARVVIPKPGGMRQIA